MTQSNSRAEAENSEFPIASRPTIEQRLAKMAVSPADAARMAGIGRTKLYEAISSGALRSFKLGRRRLIRVGDLDAWLDALADER